MSNSKTPGNDAQDTGTVDFSTTAAPPPPLAAPGHTTTPAAADDDAGGTINFADTASESTSPPPKSPPQLATEPARTVTVDDSDGATVDFAVAKPQPSQATSGRAALHTETMDDAADRGTIDMSRERPTSVASPPAPSPAPSRPATIDDPDDDGGTIAVGPRDETIDLCEREGTMDLGSRDATVELGSPLAAASRAGTIDEMPARTVDVAGDQTVDVADERTVDVVDDRTVKIAGLNQSAARGKETVEDAGTVDDAGKTFEDAKKPVHDSKKSADQPREIGNKVLVRPAGPASGTRTRHTVTRFLAEGGLGKVFVAEDVDLNREVVLKTLKSQTAKGAEAKKRFLKEAQVNAQLEHPNIIPIYQAGKDSGDGQPYYTMKFIRGKEFADLIEAYHKRRREGHDDPMEFRRLLGLFVNACHAMSYAHHRGVIHRDLKPANIAVGEFGELIVLDWGLAKVLGETETPEDDEPAAAEKSAAAANPNAPRRVSVNVDADTGLTMKGRIMGTPGYMAPEQAAGKIEEIGPPADIYALGAILFEILTGEPPHKPIHKYEGDKLSRWSKRDSTQASIVSFVQSSTGGAQTKENTMDMLGRIIAGTIPRPRDIEPSATAPLEAICVKAMKLNIADRYKTATEIADEVERWLADEKVSVHQDSWQEQLGRWMRKHRTKVQAGILALAAILLVAVVASVLINGARKAEKRQKENVAELLRQARKQIDGLMNDVIGVRENFPNFDEQSADLLLGRISEYENLRDQIKDNLLPQGDSPLLRAELGRLNMQLAFVQKRFSDLKAAQKSYEDAESIWTDLVERLPNEVNYKVNLAGTLDNLADVRLDTGMAADEALRLYDRAMQILQEVTKGDAADLLDARSTRTKIGFHKANALKALERFDEADGLYRQSMQAFLDLSKVQADKIDHLILAAETANRLMVLLTDRGRYDEALRFNDETLAAIEKAIAQHAAFGEHAGKARGVFAGNAVDRARPMEQLGLDRAAIDSYSAAAENYKSLLETPQFTNSPKFLSNLATSLYNSGLLLAKLGDAPAARDHFKAAELTSGKAYDFYANPDYLRRNVASLNAGARVTADLGALEEAENGYQAALMNTTALIAELEKNGLDTREDRRQLAIGRGGLARVLWRLGRTNEDVQAATEAIDEWQNLKTQGAEPTPNYLLGLAGFHVTRGDILFARQPAEAASDFGKATEIYEQAANRFSSAPEILNTYATFLLTCSDGDRRDAKRGLELATAAANAALQNGRYQSTLALAQYRAGRWDDAIAAADAAIRLRQPVESCLDHFIRAMALAGKGDADAAADSFARANELMTKLAPANIENVRLQTEAKLKLRGSEPE